MKSNILVVDDDYGVWSTIKMLLGEKYLIHTATNESEALKILESQRIHIILLDIYLDNESGIDLLPKIRALDSEAKIIMVTVEQKREIIDQCMKLGAFHYITKPFGETDLLAAVKSAQRAIEQKTPDNYPCTQAQEQPEEYWMIGNSLVMKKLYQELERISKTDANVLITGETGTGKELAARTLHCLGLRAKRPLFPVNCAALPEQLAESELFGHEAGAYTGANSLKKGIFELAGAGTVFLDEISELALPAQAKLLRVLENKEFMRLGGTKILTTDALVYSSSNKNMEQLIQEKRFRDDLYYRLKVMEVEIPPLRERREDIPLLVEHFKKKCWQRRQIQPKEFDPAAIEYIQNYLPWRGNVRELEHFVMKKLVSARSGKIELSDVMKPEIKDIKFDDIQGFIDNKVNSIPLTKEGIESARNNIFREISGIIYKKVLDRLKCQFHGNIADIVRDSGIERAYLYRIINQSGLKPEDLTNQ